MTASTPQGPGTVVILTGPSSAGKTSIAERLRRVTSRPAVFLSGDDLDLPRDAAAIDTLRRLPPEAIAPMEAQFHLGYFGALASFAANGLHAIGEVLFKSAESYDAFRHCVVEVPSIVVHCRCELPIRLKRERHRGNREVGIAELTTEQEWHPPDPDLVIDTGKTGVEEAAALIVARLV